MEYSSTAISWFNHFKNNQLTINIKQNMSLSYTTPNPISFPMLKCFRFLFSFAFPYINQVTWNNTPQFLIPWFIIFRQRLWPYAIWRKEISTPVSLHFFTILNNSFIHSLIIYLSSKCWTFGNVPGILLRGRTMNKTCKVSSLLMREEAKKKQINK